MKLMGEVGDEHLSEDNDRNGKLLETRENRHLDPIRAQSDRLMDIQMEKERLNPKSASSEDTYEIVTCPDPTYFVVNGSNCEYDVFSTTGTSKQPASTGSRSIDKSEIIGEDTNILSIKQDKLTLPSNGGSSASSASLQRVSDTETTSDCPKGTDEQGLSEGPPLLPTPALLLKQRRKHLSYPPSLGESKIIISSDAVSATKLYPPPMVTTSRGRLIASRRSEEKAERVATFHNFEMLEQQHPFDTGGYCNRESHSTPQPQPPPLPPLTLPRTLPHPPLKPQPSAPVPPHPLQPELQDGYNSLLGMAYDGTYDRLKR